MHRCREPLSQALPQSLLGLWLPACTLVGNGQAIFHLYMACHRHASYGRRGRRSIWVDVAAGAAAYAKVGASRKRKASSHNADRVIIGFPEVGECPYWDIHGPRRVSL